MVGFCPVNVPLETDDGLSGNSGWSLTISWGVRWVVAATELYFMISSLIIKQNLPWKLSTIALERKLTKHFHWRISFHIPWQSRAESEDDKSTEKLSRRRRSQPRYNLLFDPDSNGAGQQKAGNYIGRRGEDVRWCEVWGCEVTVLCWCCGEFNALAWPCVSRREESSLPYYWWAFPGWPGTPGERRVALVVLVAAGEF